MRRLAAHHAVFPYVLSDFRSAIRSRDFSSHLCPLRGRYDTAPRGAAEPQGDDGDVDPGMQQGHGCRVPKDVRGDVFAGQGRAGLPGCGGVEIESLLQGIAAHRSAADGGEQRAAGCPGVLGEPGSQGRDRAGASGVIRSLRPLP